MVKFLTFGYNGPMDVSLLILEPSGSQFGPLRRDFRAEADPDWDVRLVSSTDELLRRLAEQGSVDLAARAVAAGASDFLVLGKNLRQRIATLLGKLRGLFEVIDRNRLLDEHNAQLPCCVRTVFPATCAS